MSQLVKRVVVGVDGSEGSRAALEVAVREAVRHRAELCPVLAWHPPGGEALDAANPAPEDVRHIWERRARERLEEACGRTLREAGHRPRVVPVVVRADAGPALVACARHDTDLLVMGTGGHGPLHRLRYGSARRHCLRHAACPVLVVAAGESASASWADRPMPRPARRP
ncbi:universal stress protein [Streptomyces sp. UNOB3_S3]|uniref:universal stress protein n=1 Tax=Streptomyces sp. UNOB3_S3 TaxID=2871682 RepID=UPI001E2E6750|nr:universal stress protein [Streptomyces sp. UNOB3_S3]MCC3775317.1 universal stress protein [Streptomyces sp. UNOB3_S3]